MGRLSSGWMKFRSYLFGGGGGNAWTGVTPNDYIPIRRQQTSAAGVVNVTNETAMRHSAVWACLRLRADVVSSMPVDVFRKVDQVQIEMPTPPVLVSPGGDRVDICEWMYSSQVDLDRAGNVFGLITERNGANLPARIDLQALSDCSIRQKDGVLKYRIGNKEYFPDQVWHERQYTISGWPVGLSPVAYAMWSISGYLSAQKFGLDYFNGGHPAGTLRNLIMDEMDPQVIAEAKSRYKVAVENRDVFVTGKDWEWTAPGAEETQMAFLEERKFSIGDVARFFGCPGDLIDAAVTTGNITYANVTQRNLQFLIMHLGPAIYRRERALSRLLPAPRYVKLNTASLLRMDPQTQALVIGMQLDKRILTPTEARELYDRKPLTSLQVAEFEEIYGKPRDTWSGNPQPADPAIEPAPGDVPPIGAS